MIIEEKLLGMDVIKIDLDENYNELIVLHEVERLITDGNKTILLELKPDHIVISYK